MDDAVCAPSARSAKLEHVSNSCISLVAPVVSGPELRSQHGCGRSTSIHKTAPRDPVGTRLKRYETARTRYVFC